MSVLCGWASIGENGKVTGGAAGDQTGKEVKTGPYYQFGQSQLIRWKKTAHRKLYVKIIKWFCDSPLVGYNQNQRTTLYTALEKVGWDYTKLKTKVNCDCSELVVCAINCVVKKAVMPSTTTTSTLEKNAKATGLFQTTKTESKYLSTDDWLRRGDIINAPGKHVISSLGIGLMKVPTAKLKKGCENTLAVKRYQTCLNYLGYTDNKGKRLTIDGDFGSSTNQASKKFKRKYKLGVTGCYKSKARKKLMTLIK